jgi:hypothetical protein
MKLKHLFLGILLSFSVTNFAQKAKYNEMKATNVIITLISGEEVHVWEMDGFYINHKNQKSSVYVLEGGTNKTIRYKIKNIKQIVFRLDDKNLIAKPYFVKKNNGILLCTIDDLKELKLLKPMGLDNHGPFYLLDDYGQIIMLNQDLYSILEVFDNQYLTDKFWENDNYFVDEEDIKNILWYYINHCNNS